MKMFRRFVKKQEIPIAKSKGEAYQFALSKLMADGKDLITASNEAVKFAEQQAEILKLPDTIEAKEDGFKGFLQTVEYGISWYGKNKTALEPLLEFAKSAGATALGGFAGATLAENTETVEPIAYADEIQEVENTEITNENE